MVARRYGFLICLYIEILFLTREHKSISSCNRLMFCLLCGRRHVNKHVKDQYKSDIFKNYKCKHKTRINFTYLKMSVFISNVNLLLCTNQRPFVFSKQQQ